MRGSDLWKESKERKKFGKFGYPFFFLGPVVGAKEEERKILWNQEGLGFLGFSSLL